MDPLSAGIAAGSNLLAGGLNAAASGNLNRKNRMFAREMFAREAQQNERFWNMQNEYNNPVNQMQRLKDAGLNPALMYKSGSGSAGIAGPISSVKGQNPSTYLPNLQPIADAGKTAFDTMVNTAVGREQASNIRSQAQVNRTVAVLNATKNISGKLDNKLKSSILQTQVDAAKTLLAQQKQDLTQGLKESEMRIAQSGQNITEIGERILNYRIGRAKTKQELENLKETKKILIQDGLIRKAEAVMVGRGIFKSDPLYMRMLNQLLSNPESAQSMFGNIQRYNPAKPRFNYQQNKAPKKKGLKGLLFPLQPSKRDTIY